MHVRHDGVELVELDGFGQLRQPRGVAHKLHVALLLVDGKCRGAHGKQGGFQQRADTFGFGRRGHGLGFVHSDPGQGGYVARAIANSIAE